MMFVHVLLLCCLSAADFSEISQPVRVQSVKLGGSATIQCHIKGNFDTRVWYRLTSAKTLQFVANFNTNISHVELSEDVVGRYSVDASGSNNHLKISPTTWTDVGTYYCGLIQQDRVQFGGGTFLMLEGAKMSSVVQNPPSQSVQPGASVTLGCSVHTDLCTPEHTRVTWLKTPRKSPPEINHWSGSDESRCTNDRCVYELLLRNLSPDDAGTFFCVAAACGQVLLGGGTELSITPLLGQETELNFDHRYGVYVSAVSSIILSAVTLCLIITCVCADRKERFPRYADSEIIDAKKLPNTWSQCVYERK